jgi:hypothetical protein
VVYKPVAHTSKLRTPPTLRTSPTLIYNGSTHVTQLLSNEADIQLAIASIESSQIQTN